MILERHPELRRLSAADKLALVSELWDELAAHPEDVPVAPELIGAWRLTVKIQRGSRLGKP